MNEPMVYGGYIFTPACDGTTISYRYTIDKSQLALFALRPDLICNRAYWWLRDVVSGAHFAYVDSCGNANCKNAATALLILLACARLPASVNLSSPSPCGWG